jgi:hypothetical protein
MKTRKQFHAFVGTDMEAKLKMVNDPEMLKRIFVQDQELLAKVLEYFENGYGEIYKQMLIEQLRNHIRRLN